jgi:capsular polysaccharide transport system permease protein
VQQYKANAETQTPTVLRVINHDRQQRDHATLNAAERPRSWRRHASFVVCFVVPLVLAMIYYGGLAADRYESEVKFVVRSPMASAAGQLSSLVQGSTVVRSADDAHIVLAYLTSRAALRELMAEVPLRDMLMRAPYDVVWAYPLPFLGESEQRLHNHFLRFVTSKFDQTTGISTLTIQAFVAEDAAAIAAALLRNAEKLINRLNERVRGDAVELARQEVQASEAVAIERQRQMTEFRMRWSLIDPVKVSSSAHQTIAKLSLEAAQAKAQLAEMKVSSPQSAQIPSLRQRISALEEQVRNEQHQLAGSDDSLAPRLAEYERDLLIREFAERSFASAMSALEIARAEALRQKLYLEQITTPVAADHYRYPFRILSILIVAAIGYACHTIARRMLSAH